MKDEKCNCEKCEGYEKYLAWKAKQTKQLDPERMGELLGDYERDKRQLAEALETDPIHAVMLREIADLKCRPQKVTTYTKSYVSAPFGTEDSPLEQVELKSGEREIAVIPVSLLREMFDELRPILDSENAYSPDPH
jgi:hypothetical protein